MPRSRQQEASGRLAALTFSSSTLTSTEELSLSGSSCCRPAISFANLDCKAKGSGTCEEGGKVVVWVDRQLRLWGRGPG